MRSTFTGLNIANSGLRMAQIAMDLTGHNIANADTVGFTRQRLATAAIPPMSGKTLLAVDRKFLTGNGVAAQYIEQIRNPFLDAQYRKENANTQYWNAKETQFSELEGIFNTELDKIDDNTSVSSVFSSFYKSLYRLTENPSDKSIRMNVLENALKLTDTMNHYAERLRDKQINLNDSVKVVVNEINDIASSIAVLNEKIYSFELGGAFANDLRDQRNVLLDTLSGKANIEYYEDLNGYLVVELDGQRLVSHMDTKKLMVSSDPLLTQHSSVTGTPLYSVFWQGSDGKPIANREVQIDSGELKAYIDLRDGDSEGNVGIPFMMKQLDELCQKIVSEFNAVHMQGYTIPSSTDPLDPNSMSQTGIKFFDDFGALDGSLVTALNFSVSLALQKDVYLIAASDKPILTSTPNNENDQKGNNINALKLVELINKKDVNGNPDNFDSYYRDLVVSIGMEMSHIIRMRTTQDIVSEQIVNSRRSVSDVSLDEEMTNVIKFGHSYNAAARVITTMDEILDVLINRVGLVGR